MTYVIGIDPDSKEHGIAVYENSVLVELASMDLFSFYHLLKNLLKTHCHENFQFAIEDVTKMSAVFAQRQTNNSNTNSRKANNVGMCQQAMIELVRMLKDELGFDDNQIKYYQINSRWKSTSQKQSFQEHTGWQKHSNKDTRSAAYFGFARVTEINYSKKLK